MRSLRTACTSLLFVAVIGCGAAPQTSVTVTDQPSLGVIATSDAGTTGNTTRPAMPSWADLSGRWTMTLTVEPRIAELPDGGINARTLGGRGTARLPVELQWQDGAWAVFAFAQDGSRAMVIAPRVEASWTQDRLTAALPAQHFLITKNVPFTLTAGGMSVDYAPDYAMFIRLLDSGPAELVSANRLRFARVAADTTEGGADELPTAVGPTPAVSFVSVELTR